MRLALLLVLQLTGVPSAEQVSPRIERLQQWLDAVERHQPGTVDDLALHVRTWPRSEINRVFLDLRAVLKLLRQPKATIFLYEPDPNRPARLPAMVVYSGDELDALRALARGAAQRGDGNRILRRGAMLHMVIGMLEVLPAGEGAGPAGPPAPGPQQITLHLTDGRALGFGDSVGHWEFARKLLDAVTPDPKSDVPDPAGDAMVRLWYRATAAYMLNRTQLVFPHFVRALQLFPADANILFLAGGFHEALASSRIQNGLRSSRPPSGVTFDVASERDEWRLAEALYRRALRADPTLAEARVRLGRVLGHLKRPAEAVKELRAGIAGTTDPLLRYYGELFLAREADSLGDSRQTHASYQRAAALYPFAQAPRLGLSELATRSGDRTGALDTLNQALRTPVDGTDREADPWWSYDIAAGRAADELFAELIALFPSAEPQ